MVYRGDLMIPNNTIPGFPYMVSEGSYSSVDDLLPEFTLAASLNPSLNPENI